VITKIVMDISISRESEALGEHVIGLRQKKAEKLLDKHHRIKAGMNSYKVKMRLPANGQE